MAKRTVQKKQKRNKETRSRADRGSVSITNRDGNLRINVPAKHSPTGEQWQHSLGLPDTPENWAKAQKIARKINAHISLLEDYDPQKLEEYVFGKSASIKPNTITNSSPCRRAEPLFDKLWATFASEKRALGKIAETTYQGTYQRIASQICNLSIKDLSDATAVVTKIRSHYSNIVSYQTLKRVLECCEWAVENGMIRNNPFKKLLEGLRAPKPELNPDPFSRIEVKRIIAAFEAHPDYKRYVPYLRFKFETGCRPAEAEGLRWRHIDFKKGEITFCEIITYVNGKYVAKNGTKTVPKRTFKLSPSLKKFLEKIMPVRVSPDHFVFPEPDGSHFNRLKFYSAWHAPQQLIASRSRGQKTGIVSQLAQTPWEEGGISHYRPPYNTRHTYITETLEKMAQNGGASPSKVAKLAKRVGTSKTVIDDYYLGCSNDEEFPEFFDEEFPEFFDEEILDPSSTPQPKDMALGNRESAQQLIDALTAEIEELQQQKRDAKQKLAQVLSAQIALQPIIAVEGQTEPTSIPEAELAVLASFRTVMDELS